MSSYCNNLLLEAISRLGIDEVRYTFLVHEEVHYFIARINDFSGIRSIEFPEKFDDFLRPFLANDPGIVKNLVRLTWSFVDGTPPIYPIPLL